jgi:hypothetical protein
VKGSNFLEYVISFDKLPFMVSSENENEVMAFVLICTRHKFFKARKLGILNRQKSRVLGFCSLSWFNSSKSLHDFVTKKCWLVSYAAGIKYAMPTVF